MIRIFESSTYPIALEWRENALRTPDTSLYLNNLYVGSITYFDPTYVKSLPAGRVVKGYSPDRPWRGFAVVSEDGNGSHVGWFPTAENARVKVGDAILQALGYYK
jgi:hypothetical protein